MQRPTVRHYEETEAKLEFSIKSLPSKLGESRAKGGRKSVGVRGDGGLQNKTFSTNKSETEVVNKGSMKGFWQGVGHAYILTLS